MTLAPQSVALARRSTPRIGSCRVDDSGLPWRYAPLLTWANKLTVPSQALVRRGLPSLWCSRAMRYLSAASR